MRWGKRGVERGVRRSDPGEARKGQIMQGFTSHAQAFGPHPKGNRNSLKDNKLKSETDVPVKETSADTGAQIGGWEMTAHPLLSPVNLGMEWNGKKLKEWWELITCF